MNHVRIHSLQYCNEYVISGDAKRLIFSNKIINLLLIFDKDLNMQNVLCCEWIAFKTKRQHVDRLLMPLVINSNW